MKRKTLVALLLLCTTLLLIVGLQLYSIFFNYKVELDVFKRKINHELKQSVSVAFQEKRAAVIEDLETYLNDTTKIKISCKWDERNQVTQFTMTDVDTSSWGSHKVTFSKNDITERIDTLTPEKKERFIKSFLVGVDYELQKGTVWFYTQNIGDFLNTNYLKKAISLEKIAEIYQERLASNLIFEPFKINPDNKSKNEVFTQKINMSINKVSPQVIVQAMFNNPFVHIIQKQTIILLGSFLLVLLSLTTFTYMLKTLLSQQKLNEQKDQLVTNITHELKTPLTTIQMTAEALKAFELTKTEQENYLNIILQQTHSLDKMTTEILNEARVGELRPEIQNVGLAELISTISHPEINIINKVDIMLYLPSDPKILGKVLQNLVDNAAKYNLNSVKHVIITASENAHSYTVSLNDNGIGIPDMYKKTVFERFFRIPTQDVHDNRGYGIGLSYVQQAMKVLGGKIEIKDNLPIGTTFILSFKK